MPRVSDFAFDDLNVDKMGMHGITDRRARQLLDGPHIIVRNRKGRRGTYLLIGRDHGGACIAVPIEPTSEAEVWRPITGWLCKEHEKARLQRSIPDD